MVFRFNIEAQYIFTYDFLYIFYLRPEKSFYYEYNWILRIGLVLIQFITITSLRKVIKVKITCNDKIFLIITQQKPTLKKNNLPFCKICVAVLKPKEHLDWISINLATVSKHSFLKGQTMLSIICYLTSITIIISYFSNAYGW